MCTILSINSCSTGRNKKFHINTCCSDIPDSKLKHSVQTKRVNGEGAHLCIRVHQLSSVPDPLFLNCSSSIKNTQVLFRRGDPPSLACPCCHHKIWHIKTEPTLSLKNINSLFTPQAAGGVQARYHC